jgi:predicted RNase H-like HicB family nuclease
MRHYIAVIERTKSGTYSAYFPDFAGCVTAGDDLEEVLANAREALAFHVEGMREDGTEVPEPGAGGKVKKESPSDTLALIPLEGPIEPQRFERINITLEAGLLGRIDRAAKETAQTRSGFLSTIARRELETARVVARKAPAKRRKTA